MGTAPGTNRGAGARRKARSPQLPQVRQTPEPFQSKLLTFLRGHTDVLQRLVAEMDARGLSTRDIEDALRDGTGRCLVSASAVSELTDRLWEDYEAFTKRDLSGFAVEYRFLDAIYESLRLQGGPAEALRCAGAILADGRKVLLHLPLGNQESYGAWLAMLRNLVRRGLRTPVRVTSDGAPGLVRRSGTSGRRVCGCAAGSTRCATSWPKCPSMPAPR
ncbi:MAG: transposase [Armatimonadota bacterium]|nr:transposase [Armatimonadota bacterium]